LSDFGSAEGVPFDSFDSPNLKPVGASDFDCDFVEDRSEAVGENERP